MSVGWCWDDAEEDVDVAHLYLQGLPGHPTVHILMLNLSSSPFSSQKEKVMSHVWNSYGSFVHIFIHSVAFCVTPCPVWLAPVFFGTPPPAVPLTDCSSTPASKPALGSWNLLFPWLECSFFRYGCELFLHFMSSLCSNVISSEKLSPNGLISYSCHSFWSPSYFPLSSSCVSQPTKQCTVIHVLVS